jgi:hypothetical protein
VAAELILTVHAIVLLPGPDDVWVLFLEAAFAMMAAGKNTIDYECYAAIHGGLPHVGIMGLTGASTCIFSPARLSTA